MRIVSYVPLMAVSGYSSDNSLKGWNTSKPDVRSYQAPRLLRLQIHPINLEFQMRLVQNMLRKSVLFITFICISNISFAEDCGPDYPADLECLPGGTYQRTVDMMSIATAIVITYEMPRESLYEEVRSLLDRSDWVVEEWREEQEAEGTRYRVSISKGDRKIGIAIFGPGDTSVLQVTVILV